MHDHRPRGAHRTLPVRHIGDRYTGITMEQPIDAAAIEQLRGALVDREFTIELPENAEARRERVELLDQIDDYLLPRLRRIDAPLLAVLGGSTGAGKSTITNSLVGADVTTAGVLRPTTRAPVLVCHPDDLEWFENPEGVLAGLPRSASASAVGEVGLRLTTSDQLNPGLALLDAPDIDSIEVANHDLAAQLLGAADLWLFVTTAARYADAVPWEYLGLAQDRAAALAIVINRIPPGSEEEVQHHFDSMLVERQMASTAVFAVAERALDDSGQIGAELDPVREWLGTLAADASQRQELVARTLDGALTSIPDRVERIASALDEQEGELIALRDIARRRYAAAIADIDRELDRGTLLRGEVLDQWREFVGTGAFMSKLESGVSKVRDSIRAIFQSGPTPDQQAAGQLESNLSVVARDAVDKAALDVVEGWEARPVGAKALAEAPRGLERASRQLQPDLEHELAAWQQFVLDLVREQSGDKLTLARTLSTGINGIGVALMVVVFSQTGGVTGTEAAVATGTAAVSQTVLTAVFGEQAVRDLARAARSDLIERLERLLEADRQRFEDLIDVAESGGKELRDLAAPLRATR